MVMLYGEDQCCPTSYASRGSVSEFTAAPYAISTDRNYVRPISGTHVFLTRQKEKVDTETQNCVSYSLSL